MTFDEQPVLLVEDNEDDAFIFCRSFKQAPLKHPLYFAENGQQAIDYLAGAGDYSDRAKFPFPLLMMLDLKLPLHNGLEVLEWIGTRPQLAPVSVVVLTSSAEQRDLHRAAELGARGYMLKPPSSKMLLSLFASLRTAPIPGGHDHRLRFDGDLLGSADGRHCAGL